MFWGCITPQVFIASLILCLWYITAGEGAYKMRTCCNNEDYWKAEVTLGPASSSTLSALPNLCGTQPWIWILNNPLMPLSLQCVCIQSWTPRSPDHTLGKSPEKVASAFPLSGIKNYLGSRCYKHLYRLYVSLIKPFFKPLHLFEGMHCLPTFVIKMWHCSVVK